MITQIVPRTKVEDATAEDMARLQVSVAYVEVLIKKTTGDLATAKSGTICINEADNNIKIRGDGGWRQVATW